MVPMNFYQCWKAKLERPHFLKVQSGKITVWYAYCVLVYYDQSTFSFYKFLRLYREKVYFELRALCW